MENQFFMDFVDHPFPHIYIPSNLPQRYEMIYQYKNYNKPNKIQTKLCPNKLAKFQLSMNIESMNIFNSSMLNWMQLEEICTELHIQRPLHLFLLSALHLPHCHHHQVPSQTTVKYFPLFKSSSTQAQCIILCLSNLQYPTYIYREIFICPCFIFTTSTTSTTSTPSVFRQI